MINIKHGRLSYSTVIIILSIPFAPLDTTLPRVKTIGGCPTSFFKI